MGNYLNDQLVSLGVTTKLIDGTREMQGQIRPLLPAILGRLGDDKNKKTVPIYGHYYVQPVSLSSFLVGCGEAARMRGESGTNTHKVTRRTNLM